MKNMVETSNINKVIEEIIYSIRTYTLWVWCIYRIYNIFFSIRDYPKQYEQMIGIFFFKEKTILKHMFSRMRILTFSQKKKNKSVYGCSLYQNKVHKNITQKLSWKS